MRREVLGDEHVDKALAGATDLTRDFQDFITTLRMGRHLDPARGSTAAAARWSR